MCFSATASFGAAAVLGAIGGAAVRAAPSRAHLPIAAVPLLFAAQQACEGALWIVLEQAPFGKGDSLFGRAFLLFALSVWPAYVPAALAPIEPNAELRRALVAFAIGGALLGAYLFGCASLRDSDACIAFGNLYYFVQLDAPVKPALPYLYAAFVVLPLVVSSRRGTSLFAAATLIAFAVAGLFFRAGFVSVWCFFAAALSGAATLVACSRRRSAEALRADLTGPGRSANTRP